MIGTQTIAAFWIQVSLPPMSYGSPPMAPKAPKVMIHGSRNCITDTPALPSPALRPSARPCIRFGKKKLMLDIDEAKAPPPTPEMPASTTKVKNGVSGFCSAMPAPTAGRHSIRVVMNLTFRPPQMAIMNEFGMRSVAPIRPATAGRVNSSAR